jgi:hypothetical protein
MKCFRVSQWHGLQWQMTSCLYECDYNNLDTEKLMVVPVKFQCCSHNTFLFIHQLQEYKHALTFFWSRAPKHFWMNLSWHMWRWLQIKLCSKMSNMSSVRVFFCMTHLGLLFTGSKLLYNEVFSEMKYLRSKCVSGCATPKTHYTSMTEMSS